MELYMAQESVWFDQSKFEEAETRYQEAIATRHSGLKIEVVYADSVSTWDSVSTYSAFKCHGCIVCLAW